LINLEVPGKKNDAVEIKPVGSLPRFEGKAVRVVDKRG
jgi:phenylacetate-coenzyme A ligase PaaK-like adenylate-forming protein